jgi:hypothetical protein
MIRKLINRLIGRKEVPAAAVASKRSSATVRLQHGVAVALVDFDARARRSATVQVSRPCGLK